MLGVRYGFSRWGIAAIFLLLGVAWCHAAPASEPTVEELKSRLAATNAADRPHLCLLIAQKQMVDADKFYAANDIEKGQAALTDVVAFSELARDYSIQSHKHQKQTEIATRNIMRKLTDLLHTLSRADQGPVLNAISRLQRVSDDLLASMFTKGAK